MREPLFKSRIALLVPGFSLALLVAIAFLNRHTPFRGEHWALLYAYVNAPDWPKRLEFISRFGCWGSRRFQPLGFFPQALSFQLLGTSFFAHYLVSIAIHFAQTYVFLKTLDRFRSDDSDTRSVFERYPLEAAFFLLLFPAADVLFWTLLHHEQLATLLATTSALIYVTPASRDSGRYSRRLLAFALMLLATAFYEAFLSALAIYCVVECTRFFRGDRAAWRGAALLAGVVAALGIKYGVQYPLNPQVAAVPFLTKAIHTLEYTFLALTLTLSNSISPAAAWRGKIYTLPIPHAILAMPWPLFSAAVATGLVLLSLVVIRKTRKTRKARKTDPNTGRLYAFYVANALGIFLLIAWARSPEGPIATSAQFRYAFILLSWLAAIALDFARRFLTGRSRYVYSGLLAVIIAANAMGTLRHGLRLKADMADMTDYVENLKREGFTADEIVTDVTRKLAAAQFPLSQQGKAISEFILNGDGCAEEWVYRTAGREKQYAELLRAVRNARP